MEHLYTGLRGQELADNTAPQLIFHADDDRDDREHFRTTVAGIAPQAEIRGFSNGLELIQSLTALETDKLPGIIFLDLRMPIWDGIKTLNALHINAKFCHIPVFMMSAADSKAEMDLCIKSGAKAFLTKSVSNAEHLVLTEKLRALLNNIQHQPLHTTPAH